MAERDAKGRCKPGHSLNPGGRVPDETILKHAEYLLTPKERERMGLTPEQSLSMEWVKAKRMKINLLVLFDGPQSERDSVWSKINEDFGNRWHGKPKETIELVEAPTEAAIDWTLVPLAERKELLGALEKIEQLVAASTASDTVEH